MKMKMSGVTNCEKALPLVERVPGTRYQAESDLNSLYYYAGYQGQDSKAHDMFVCFVSSSLQSVS